MSSLIRATVAGASNLDIMSGFTGVFEVEILEVGANNFFYSEDVSATTTGVPGTQLCRIAANGAPAVKFTWDASKPLYAYNVSGSSQFVSYVLSDVTSVGLSVKCS